MAIAAGCSLGAPIDRGGGNNLSFILVSWGTHVVLAAKLLESCGLDKGAAIYSNLPVIDNKPAHYHRVYAHILENQPSILDVAIEIFGSEEVASRDFDALARRMTVKIDNLKKGLERASGYEERSGLEKEIYAYTRLTEEAETFVDLANKARNLLADNDIAKISSDKMSAAVSLISHIYFDTFNNPVQVFLPGSSIPSGQWDFWDSVDYMRLTVFLWSFATLRSRFVVAFLPEVSIDIN